jgi:hypothetical protein
MTSGTERFILLLSGAIFTVAPLIGARQQRPLAIAVPRVHKDQRVPRRLSGTLALMHQL